MRLILVLLLAISVNASEEISFRNDVLPVLSKNGCNSGGCHGALAGKGGFRLSLFGYNPEADHLAITRESRGRRIEISDPGASLLLLKPTTAVKHKGGKRLDVGSDDYQLLAKWVAQGAPGPKESDAKLLSLSVSPAETEVRVGDTMKLAVRARFSDGKERDVTPWVKFTSADETVASVDGQGNVTVIGPGVGAITAWYSSQIVIARLTAPFNNIVPDQIYTQRPRANFIDDLVLAQLHKLKLRPAPPADDYTFVRRAYLDTIGRLPRPEEVEDYAQNQNTDSKQEVLANRLLKSPEFVDYWAYKWSDILLVTGSKLRPNAVKAYYEWIRKRVAENTPWDQMVRELVTARGSSMEQGASNFYAVHNDPESMAENVSQAFLSLSIGCARCHNHPLEKWTNDQYYQFANLFSRVRAKGWGGDARSGDGVRTLYAEDSGDLIQPRTGKPQPPAPLDGAPIPADDPRDRREILADWLTSPGNPYFSRAIVNRIWANFMGVGLVEQVDDLRASNPASNEKLLAALAKYAVDKKYDLREVIRAILVSKTYSRSSDVRDENREDRRHYSRYFPRRLTAEVLNDAIADVTLVRDKFTEVSFNDGSGENTSFYTNDFRAIQLYDSTVKSYFLKTFGRNSRDITCECERSNQPSLVQALHLSNGNAVNDKLAARESRVSKLLAEKPEKIIREAWMLALSRPPTATEENQVKPLIAVEDEKEKRLAVEDMFWSLLTSREFLFQH